MHRLLACLALTGLIGCSTPAGFQPIFNDKDLSSFQTVGPAMWSADDGLITGRQDPSAPGGGYLVTDHTWRDFELFLEFKVVPQYGRSAVVVRDVKAGAGDPMRDGCVVQILDREDAPFKTGSILGSTPSLDGAQKSGWNELRILAFKEWLRVDLNGTKVAEAKVRNVGEGSIDLYCPGGRAEAQTRVYFRNVRIKALYVAPLDLEDKLLAPEGEPPEEETPAEPVKTPEELLMEKLTELFDAKLAPIAEKLNAPAPAPEAVFGPIIDKKLAEFEAKIAPSLARAAAPEAAVDAAIVKRLAELEAKVAPLLAKAAEAPPSPEPVIDAVVTKKLAELEAKLTPLLAKAAEAPPSPEPVIDAVVTKKLAEFEAKIAPLLAKLAEPKPAPETALAPVIDQKLADFFRQQIVPLFQKLPEQVYLRFQQKKPPQTRL